MSGMFPAWLVFPKQCKGTEVPVPGFGGGSGGGDWPTRIEGHKAGRPFLQLLDFNKEERINKIKLVTAEIEEEDD